MSSRVQLNVNHSEWGEKTHSWWMQIQHKCRQLVSALLTSVSNLLIAKEQQKWPYLNHDAHKSTAFISPKSDFLLMQSNHRRISFHLVLPCTAKYQESTCPQVPRLYVNTPVCVKIRLNLNLKIFSAFATYTTKQFNSGPLSKVRTAWNEIIHSEEDY